MKKILVLLFAAVCSIAPLGLADDHHDGHMAANEQLGTVNFPISCSPADQKSFERGVALLHSFWYEEAEKQFEQVAAQDPHCAMAHWGIAMSLWHQLWDHPDAKTIAKGQAEVKMAKSLHPPTQRQKEYIAAAAAFYKGRNVKFQVRADAYTAAMARLHKDFPGDDEAGAFYGLALLASEPDNAANIDHRTQAAAVLEPIFASQPQHPGVAHYLIHAYDCPELAQQGLPAAERYSKIAPASPHAVHMPSHIYARLGMWQEDIQSNQRSVELTRATAAMGMGGEGHQFHAMDFLMYAYLQSGRDGDALKLIEEVKVMPPIKPMPGMHSDPHLGAQARYPAFYDIELRHWSDAASLAPVDGANERNERVYWARAIGAARSGQARQAAADLDQLAAFRKQAEATHDSYEIEILQSEQSQAQAWLDHAMGRNQPAIDSLTKLAHDEESAAFRNEVGGVPSREMLADMLLEMDQPAQALVEYQADLKWNPNRFNALYGAAQAAEKSGKPEQANAYYATLVKMCAGSDRPELQHAKSLVAAK